MVELAKFLRVYADWQQNGICGKAPEVVEHIEHLLKWAAEVEALEAPETTIPPSAEEVSEQMKHYLNTNTILCGVPIEMIREWRRALHNAYTEGYVQRGLDDVSK